MRSVVLAEAQKKEVGRLEKKRGRLLDLLVGDTIDEQTYKRRMDKIKTQLALAKMDERTCEAESFDMEAVQGLAEQMLLEPRRMWSYASLKQKRRLQGLLFPEGLTWRDGKFGTVVTCHVLKHLRATRGGKSQVARPTGLEPATLGSTVRYSGQLSYGPARATPLWWAMQGLNLRPLACKASALAN